MLRRQQLVTLAEDNLRSHERIFDQITRRSERGVGRMADQDHADARLSQARNNLITEQTNLADAQVNFFSVVGADAAQLQWPTGVSLPTDLPQAREAMLQSNALLSSAQADVQAAEQQYRAAQSLFYPHFYAELSRSADNNIDGAVGHSNEWQAMVNMRFNLFAGGSDRAEKQARAHQVDQALDIRNNALRVLTEELGLAWNALDNARRQLPIAEQYVQRSGKVREAYQSQFGLGERTLLDLLDSENELFAAQRRLEDVRFAELFNQYRIQAILGSLLRSQGVVPPMESTPLDEVRVQAQLPEL